MTVKALIKKSCLFALVATLLLALAACGAPAAIPNPPLVLGEKYLADLDYEQALLQFDQAIAIEPKNPRGYLGKADALLHLGRQADAAQALGAGAKATRGETRAALRAVRAEAEKSAVDGYIGLSSAYHRLGWRDIALLLLKRVCEELPEEGRLREALEKLVYTIEHEAHAIDRTEAMPVVVPDDVFNEKDMEAVLGVAWDDIYAVAAKLGFTRAAIDEVRSNVDQSEDSYNSLFSIMNEAYYASISTYNNNNPISESMYFYVTSNSNPCQQYHFDLRENVAGIVFPRGTYIGMGVDEVFVRFNHDNFDNHVMITDNDHLRERSIYRYDDYNTSYFASWSEYDNPDSDGSISFAYVVSLPNGMRQRYTIGFNYQLDKVNSINIGFTKEPKQEAAP